VIGRQTVCLSVTDAARRDAVCAAAAADPAPAAADAKLTGAAASTAGRPASSASVSLFRRMNDKLVDEDDAVGNVDAAETESEVRWTAAVQ